MKESEILKRAINHYGTNTQILVACEECSELIKELLKFVNRNADNIENIREEIADVEIMISQLKNIFGNCEKEKEEKLTRLALRIGACGGMR